MNLKEGAPDLKSADRLAFGPDGVLFVGDTKGAAIFASIPTTLKAKRRRRRTALKASVRNWRPRSAARTSA